MGTLRGRAIAGAATTVLVISLLGVAAAGAKSHRHHHSSGGTGGSSPNITVTVDPNGPNNPLIEVGQSEVYAVVQVETSPSFADDAVTVSSNQLEDSCTGAFPGFPPGLLFVSDVSLSLLTTSSASVTLTLDNEGNATIILAGTDCAPGQDLVEADLAVAPFYTATTNLTVNPPTVTTPGLFGQPQINGVTEEVETGDTPASGDSGILAVFFVEENPVYAEQNVEIESTQLQDRCQGGWFWEPSNRLVPGAPGTIPWFPASSGSAPGRLSTTVLDDDGNAAFVFVGSSCAAGTSTVVADVLAGTYDTFTTTFTVLPPQVTI